jgi:hypothetical protein
LDTCDLPHCVNPEDERGPRRALQWLPLFPANARERVAGSELVTYDVAKDGQRFLINTQMEKEESQPMMVILNWAAEFEK